MILTPDDYEIMNRITGGYGPIDRRVYVAGYRAGLERAAKECDKKADELDPGNLGLANNRRAGIACGMCASAIRALIAKGQ